MKQMILVFGSIFLLGLVLQQFFPWWIIVLVAGVVGFFFRAKPWLSFAMGFLAVALLWGTYATWLDWENGGLLSDKMGDLFNRMTGWGLILVTALMGGMLGGLGALTGSLGRQAFRGK